MWQINGILLFVLIYPNMSQYRRAVLSLARAQFDPSCRLVCSLHLCATYSPNKERVCDLNRVVDLPSLLITGDVLSVKTYLVVSAVKQPWVRPLTE